MNSVNFHNKQKVRGEFAPALKFINDFIEYQLSCEKSVTNHQNLSQLTLNPEGDRSNMHRI